MYNYRSLCLNLAHKLDLRGSLTHIFWAKLFKTLIKKSVPYRNTNCCHKIK